MPSCLSSPAAISLSHATIITTTTTTTVTFYTNTLGEKHKLNKPQTVEFPSALLTAQYALSLLPNTALLQSDDSFSAYNNLELDKLRLSADAAIHLTIVRWHLLGSAPTAEAKKAMVERQRLVCGCDNPSYLQCRIRAYAAIQRRGGKPDVRCTRFQKLPVAVTSSPTLLDLLLDAIEKEPKAELSDLAKHIQTSYPEIGTVHEIRFNDGAAIEYKITRVGDANDAERSTSQQIPDSWVKREMLWRIDSNHPHIIAFDKELANEVNFITACPGNVYQVNWKDEEASADKVTHDNLVLLGWTDKVFLGGMATHLDVGTCVTIDGEVGEIVKVQKGRGARGRPVFDVKVADKMRAKVKPSELKPAAYEVQELVDGLVDTAMDDGVKQSLQRVRLLLRALLPALPVVAMVRGEEKEADDAEEEEEVEEQDQDSGGNEEDKKKENNGKDDAKEDDEEEEETEAVDGKEERKDVEMEQEEKEKTHQATESKEKEDTGGDDDDNVEEPIEENQESATPFAGANGTRKVKQAKRKASPSTATPKSDKRRSAR